MAYIKLPSNEMLSAADSWLAPYHVQLESRQNYIAEYAARMVPGDAIDEVSRKYQKFGLHLLDHGWVYRDWAPAARKIYLHCDMSRWADDEDFALEPTEHGEWQLELPANALAHGDHYKLHVYWDDGDGYRVPAWANYVVQDSSTGIFDAVVWQPDEAYGWHDDDFQPSHQAPLIYEAHVGMSSEDPGVSTYAAFTETIIPKIKADGYNTIQLMAIAEHPYYGSFGYHVSSFFAPSSRFGTPDDFRALIDAAHAEGMSVIIDLVQSHAVKNEVEGISRYDGTLTQFFHEGDRGNHAFWDSRVFDYGKPEVASFLLSNCRYWLEEFHVDGFRFDGVTSMLYLDHGMERSFSSYDDYFQGVDDDALAYLALANTMIHDVKPYALTIAEDMSGMPGLASKITDSGIGFDYRLNMGVPDMWIKHVKDMTDEEWKVSAIFHEVSQHRPEEHTISYAESHDQALVGDKTLIFRMADKEMYEHMLAEDESYIVDRALTLHKLIYLLTASTNYGGYLNFMGNEFGHPEWIDFPRVDNEWSYHYARRQWKLADDKKLKYHFLAKFDQVMLRLVRGLDGAPQQVMTNDGDHTISFVRDDLLFVFNFHPSKSYTDYGIAAPEGDYQIVLSSDDRKFGGFDRIDTEIDYPSAGQVKLYLPARTAIVLKRK